jgi:hypothetical protein
MPIEPVLWQLLILVIVFGALYAIVRIVPFEGWIKQSALIILAALFLILLLLRVLIPMLGMAG